MRVSLFIPCLVEQFNPAVGEAAARVLARAGVMVDYPPGQTCCGQPFYKSGHRKEARKLARHFLEVFDGAEAVVAPSGSCVRMVKHDFEELFRDEPQWRDRAAALAGRVYEFTQFLVQVLKVDDLGASWPGKAVYHDSCQVSRALGIVSEPRSLLSRVKGLELVTMNRTDLCCGFGGRFSLQFPAISEAIVEKKAAFILASGAEFVIGAEPSCLMNIGGYLEKQNHPVKAVHIAQVLDSR
jgi:L-lactate dehydrogenase complex protein LldE